MSVPTSPFSRRAFLAGAGALGGAALAGPAGAARGRPTLRGSRFPEGVMSGDPSPTGITLWTRVAGAEGSGTVELEVARDREFRRVVARERIRTSGRVGHAVKARIGGLRRHEEYHYRFVTRNDASPVGRFRTALPADSRQPVRFAFFSCQDITWGFYNAHERLAREDVDFVVCLGDYIYAEEGWTRGRGGVRRDRVGMAETLSEYRRKYRFYRSDPALRRVHARFPMISIWDDHEVRNNYSGGVRGGGLADRYRYTERRQARAYRAYFESMPTYGAPRVPGHRLYRAARFGRNLDLVLLDQRQYRADQPCGDAFVADPCADLEGPRAFLGARQMGYVKRRLECSPAAWKVLAGQTMVEKLLDPDGHYLGFDSWQGYPRERRELLSHVRDNGIDGVVFVTGDVHTFIAADVRIEDGDPDPVAAEFVGGSMTSRGFGEGAGDIVPGANPRRPRTPAAYTDSLLAANPWMRDIDLDHHGYGLATAGRSSFRCTFKRVAGVKRRSAGRLPVGRFDYRLPRGSSGLS